MKLSPRERKVLEIIRDQTSTRASLGPSGPHIAQIMNADPLEIWDASAAGAHQTAASLARKGLVVRAGTSRLRRYRITGAGRAAL